MWWDHGQRVPCVHVTKSSYSTVSLRAWRSPAALPPLEPVHQPFLPGKPECFHLPCLSGRRPFEVKVPQNLRHKFTHFHDGDVLANAGSGAVSELAMD